MLLSEVREQLLRHLPRGMSPRLGPKLLAYYEGIAEMLKVWCADVLDQARKEISPLTIEQKIPDWEEAQGTADGKIAKTGTQAARRAQVIARLRGRASLSIPDIRAVMQPFFLYTDPSQIQVIETNRTALRTAHTYAAAGLPVPIPMAFPPAVAFFNTNDDGPVSDGGAVLSITISGYLEELSFNLVGPDGSSQQAFWDPGHLGTGQVTGQTFTLCAPLRKLFGELPSQLSIKGNTLGRWSLRAISRGPHTGTLHGASLFVEALGRNFKGGDGLGAAMFEFLVVADPTLLGVGHDLEAADLLLRRIRPAYTLGRVMKKNAIMGGGLLAIPDEPTTLPDVSIPA